VSGGVLLKLPFPTIFEYRQLYMAIDEFGKTISTSSEDSLLDDSLVFHVFILNDELPETYKNNLNKICKDKDEAEVPYKPFFPSDYTSGSVHSLSSRGYDSLHGPARVMGVDAFRGEITGNGGSHRVGSSVGAKMDSEEADELHQEETRNGAKTSSL
ncbi:hypothetical protein Tco_1424959, partial [Tanacetum coccineum]